MDETKANVLERNNVLLAKYSSRNVGLELFRLLCMFLITSIHLVWYTDLYTLVSSSRFHTVSFLLLRVIQLIGLNGFVLISAYFLSEKQFSVKRIVSFWIQLLFCSGLIFIVASIATRSFSLTACIQSFFPILTQHYWYPVAYLIILFASPFLNTLAKALSKKQFLLFLLLFLCTQTLLLSANPLFDSTVYLGHYSHSIIGFVFLYMIGAYLKKYEIKRKVLLGPIMLLLVFAIAFSVQILQEYTSFELPSNMQIYEYNGIVAVLLSVSAFISFSALKLKNRFVSIFVLWCSPVLLFVYLIQEHCSVRAWFWNAISKIEAYVVNPILLALIAFAVLFVAAVFLFLIYKAVKKLCLGKLEDLICSFIERITLR